MNTLADRVADRNATQKPKLFNYSMLARLNGAVEKHARNMSYCAMPCQSLPIAL